MMRAADFGEHVGTEYICANVAEALERAKKLGSLRSEQKELRCTGRRRAATKKLTRRSSRLVLRCM
jgi:hypothetical protein